MYRQHLHSYTLIVILSWPKSSRISAAVKNAGILELAEDVENAACQLWDMTAEPDVVRHLLSLEVLDVLQLTQDIISQSRAPRLTVSLQTGPSTVRMNFGGLTACGLAALVRNSRVTFFFFCIELYISLSKNYTWQLKNPCLIMLAHAIAHLSTAV